MKTPILILAVVLGCSYAVANTYYQQEYNYNTSSSDFENNELQRKTDDQGFNRYHRSRRYGVSSNLRAITLRLQQECEKDLLDAIRQNAMGRSSSRIDIDELERQLRHNLTERLNNDISKTYGQQVILDGLSYSLTGGRLQTNANFDNQEYLDLKNQLENSMLNNLRNQYSRYKSSSSSSSSSSQYYNSGDNYVHTTSTTRPPYYPANYYEASTYRPIYPSLPTDYTQSITGWFWNLINNLTQGYFDKRFDQVNHLDKRVWEGIFSLRIEQLRKQLESGLSEKVFKTDIIRSQELICKYSLSPVIYEDALEALENFVSNLDNSDNYLKILTEVRNEFREKLKAQYSLLNECVKGDANLGREEIDFYKSLLDDRSLKNSSSQKVFLSLILDKDTISKKKDINSKLRNISKFLLGSLIQAITLSSAAQLSFASAATSQPSNFSKLAVRKQSLPLNNRLLSGIKDSNVLQRNDSSIRNIVSKSLTLLLSSNSNSTLNKKEEEDTIVSTKEPSYSIFTEKVKSEINKIIIALSKDNNIQRSKRSIHADSRATNNSFGTFTRTNSGSKADMLENEIRKIKEDISQLKESTAINREDRERLILLETTVETLKKLLDDESIEMAQNYAYLESLVKSFTGIINDYEKEIVGMKRKIEEQERVQKQNMLPAECVDTIKNHDFRTAEDKIKLINDDTKINFIIKEVYNRHIGNFDLVLKFGNSIADIKRSVLVFKALSYEMESNGHIDIIKMIELIKSIHARETVDAVSPEVLREAVSIINFLENLIKNSIREKLKDSILNDHCISNSEITEFSDKVFGFSQELFKVSIKEVVNDVYGKIDTEKILDCINNHYYFAQILSGLIVVFDKMQSRDRNNRAVIQLAYSMLRLTKSPYYLNATSKERSDLECLKGRLPKSVKNMVFSSKVCIKNLAYNEYLYATIDEYKHDLGRRNVLTWVPGNRVLNGEWRLLRSGGDWGDTFIKNTRFNEYLYSDYFNYDVDRRRLFTFFIPGRIDDQCCWKFELDGDNVYIKNIKFSEYLFADYDRRYINHDRRYVFTFNTGRKTSDSLWSIEDCS